MPVINVAAKTRFRFVRFVAAQQSHTPDGKPFCYLFLGKFFRHLASGEAISKYSPAPFVTDVCWRALWQQYRGRYQVGFYVSGGRGVADIQLEVATHQRYI